MARGNGKSIAAIVNKPVTGTDRDDTLIGSATKIIGGDGNDTITGSDQADRIIAGDGDDNIFGGAGDDTIFGNDGFDTLILEGSLRDAVLTAGKGNSLILNTDEGGTDTLKHIEALQFDDFTYLVGQNNGVFTSADTADVLEDSSVAIDVLANDFDFEGDAFSITAFDASSAKGASVSLVNGCLVYETAHVAAFQSLSAGVSTTDSFTYTVTDAAGNSTTETVTVTVTGTNDAPVITGGTTTGAASEDDTTSVSGSLSASDIDSDDTLSWSVDNGTGTYGSLSIDTDGNWIYTLDNDSDAVQSLNADQTETETFKVAVTDGTETVYETIEITVHGADDVEAAGGDVFAGLGVNPEDSRIVQNWVPFTYRYHPSLVEITDFTSGDDVHTLNVNNAVYAWLDDGWNGRQSGYSFFEGDDIFAVRLGAAGGQGVWMRSGVDMGDGDDVFAIDLDSSNHGGIDGWHNGAQFVGGAGNDDFRFDIDVANYGYLSGQKIWMGDGNDSITIDVDVANKSYGFFGYGNHVTLDAGDDTYSVSINVQDGSYYNMLTGYWNGGAGNDTMSFEMSGDASNNRYDGFGGRVLGDSGDDTFIFNVERFTVSGFDGGILIDGGADYDVLVLEMGSASDYTLTDTGGGTYDLVYQGVRVDLANIEEIQFTDSTLLL